MIEDIEVAGRTAWFARPKQAAGEAAVVHGAVVVCHGGGGLGPHERAVIEKLAELGYAAVAPDLYGVKPSIEMIKGLAADRPELRARVLAAVDWIPRERGRRRGPARIAVIGYCFGGTAALEAARSGADIACAVSFHGGLAAPEPPAKIHARVLACCGGADPHCPPAQRAAFEAEMTAAGADWQLHVHGGALHAFTVRDSEDPRLRVRRARRSAVVGRDAPDLRRDDRCLTWHRSHMGDGLTVIEKELEGERASSLGEAGKRLENALLALGESSDDELVYEAATAVWYYMIVRESLRMFNHQQALKFYDVPDRVMAQVGVVKRQPRAVR